MKTVELFSGTQSFSKVAKEFGHETFCIDNNPKFNNDWTIELDSGSITKIMRVIMEADIVWMSPPCTTFSMASGNTHWTKDRKPKTKEAEIGKDLLLLCLMVAEICIKNNKIFFIENPRARARWFLPEGYRKTAWYCQYGDTRAKPTDIWTNLNWTPKTCHNGNKNCPHEPAPRGSKTGTQGLKGNKERSVVPRELIKEIFFILNSNSELHNYRGNSSKEKDKSDDTDNQRVPISASATDEEDIVGKAHPQLLTKKFKYELKEKQ